MGVKFDPARIPTAMDPLDPTLVADLGRFVNVTRGLTQSPVFKQPQLALELTPEAGGFVPALQAPVDDLGMRGMLTYFRQLWQDGEATQFSALRSRVRVHVASSNEPDRAGLRAFVDDLGKQYSKVRREAPDFRVLEAEHFGKDGEVAGDGNMRIERILDDWVNGEVFHSDQEKRDRVLGPGVEEMSRFALLAAVQAMSKIYVLFARLAKAILDEPAVQPQ